MTSISEPWPATAFGPIEERRVSIFQTWVRSDHVWNMIDEISDKKNQLRARSTYQTWWSSLGTPDSLETCTPMHYHCLSTSLQVLSHWDQRWDSAGSGKHRSQLHRLLRMLAIILPPILTRNSPTSTSCIWPSAVCTAFSEILVIPLSVRWQFGRRKLSR